MSTTLLRVQFSPRRWRLLEAFIAVPDGKHASGGLQNRRRKWKTQIDARFAGMDKWQRWDAPKGDGALCYIELDEDDAAFIRRTIGNANGGGFQASVADIFTDVCAEFTAIPRTKKR